MPVPENLVKAELREIEWDKSQKTKEINKEKTVQVQFNPETLTVNFSNQKVGGDQRGGSAIQFVGEGTTKLSLDLWFDATVAESEEGGTPPEDVRKLTDEVNYFIRPVEKIVGGKKGWVPPAVRFIWGTFLFDGVMDSINEKLEYFSEDGKPLRAMVSISLSSQTIQFKFGDQKSGNIGGTSTPATQPQQPAKTGDTVQKMATAAGRGDDWKQIAAANGIENPRQIAPGTLIDLN